MRNWINLLGCVVALGMSGAAFAQSTENSEGGAAADSSVPSLSMGVDERVPGRPYVKETHGDWELRCVRAQNDDEICQLYQLMKDGEGNSVAEFNIFPLPPGGQAVAGANIVTPLETLLTEPLRLAVDGGQSKRYPYSFCSQVGCFSRIGLTADEVAGFRKGVAATITIVPAGAADQTVQLKLSLSGFTAGFNSLSEIEKARTASE